MKTYISLLFFIFINLCYSHKNVQLEFKIGKINLTTSTHDYNEEINKSLILVKYANVLLDSLNYNKDILILNFQNSRNYLNAHYSLDENLLCFNKFDLSTLDIKKILNFMCHVIINEKRINFSKPFDAKNVKTNYELVDKIISEKVERPNEIKELDNLINFSYYYKNNKYFFYETFKKNIILLEIDNFLQVENLTATTYVIFLTDTKFVVIKNKKAIVEHYLTKTPKDLLKFKLIRINEDYCFIQYKWRQELVLIDLKNNTITENYYEKLKN